MQLSLCKCGFGERGWDIAQLDFRENAVIVDLRLTGTQVRCQLHGSAALRVAHCSFDVG